VNHPKLTEFDYNSDIGIVELHHGHPQYLSALCRMAKASGADVSVFTTDFVYDQISTEVGGEGVNFVLKHDEKSMRSFMNSVEHDSSQLDFLIFLTPNGLTHFSLAFLHFNPHCPAACYCFNGNRITRASNIPANIVDIIKNIAPLLSNILNDESILSRGLNFYILRRLVLRDMIKKYDGIIVEYPPIKDYINNNSDIETSIYCMPPVLCDFEYRHVTQQKTTNPLHVVVPGRITNRVRNYDSVISVSDELFPERNKSLKITILGTPQDDSGQEILRRVQTLAAKGHNISINELETVSLDIQDLEWIPSDKFRQVLNSCDILLNPCRDIETRPVGIPDEVRGRSKGSGILFDSLQHKKPLILPSHFTIDQIISNHTISYTGPTDLARLLNQLIINRERVTALQRAALNDALKYRLTHQAHRFASIASDIISSIRH
jgi:glycosyltransferase involved in cell wall biosynthesis